MVTSGQNAIVQVPFTRWQPVVGFLSAPHSLLQRMQNGGFLRRAERFDNGFFSISPAEASVMDPQQRLLLEHGYTALNGSGHERSELLGRDVGVMVAIQAADFGSMTMAHPVDELPVYAVSGFTFSVAAGRLSFVLGMQGPCYNADTACSTALVVTHAPARP